MSLSLHNISHFKSPYHVLGYLLRLMSQIWHRRLNAELASIDLTEMQFVLLVALGQLADTHKEDVSQKELAEACGCSAALASQVLRKLAAKKLVRIEVDARDTRARAVRLSKLGEDRILQAVKILERTDEAFRADDPAIFQTLFDALQGAVAVKLAATPAPVHDLGAMPLTEDDELPKRRTRRQRPRAASL